MQAKSPDRWRKNRCTLGISGVILASLLAVTSGCSQTTASSSTAASSASSSSSASSASGNATSATIDLGAPGVAVSSAAFSGIIKRAFLADINPSSLDPITVQALRRAAVALTPSQVSTFQECMKNTVCDTGHGSVTIALVEDNNNGFRTLFRAENVAQALTYPAVRKIIWTNANGDLATFLANFRSMIVQHVNVILGAFDFGSSMLPVVKQAAAAGILVVPTTEPIPNATAPQDVLTTVSTDICGSWTAGVTAMVGKMGRNRTYGMYTGIPGNPYAAVWQPCARKVLDAAGWKQVITGTTNWTPQGSKQAANALLASGKNPDAILYEYTPEDFIQPFISAGKTPPTVFTGGTSQAAWFNLYSRARASGIHFNAYVSQGQAWLGRVSITAAMDKLAGQPVPGAITLPAPAVPITQVLSLYESNFPAALPMAPLVSNQQIAIAYGS